jgi:hypothetical protein
MRPARAGSAPGNLSAELGAMTLRELIETARATLSRLGDRPLDTQSDGDAHALATGVLDLLGADTVPCGLETPTPHTHINRGHPPAVCIPDQYGGATIPPDEARALAALLLLAADKAERIGRG